MKHKKVLTVITLGSALILGVTISGFDIVKTWESVINKELGITNYKIIGGENARYISDYQRIEDLVEAKKNFVVKTLEEGSVLLKNENNALPLNKGDKISMFGHLSVSPIMGRPMDRFGDTYTGYESWKAALDEVGLELNPTLWNYYSNSSEPRNKVSETSYTIGEINPSKFTSEVKNSYANYSDAAIFTFGRHFGEGIDASTDPNIIKDGDGKHYVLQLQDDEREVIKEAKKCSKKVIVIVNSDTPLEIGELKDDPDIDAIMMMPGTGSWGLLGAANILVGNANPSGHLTDTWARSNLSAPATVNFGDMWYTNVPDSFKENKNNTNATYSYVVYQEGIYVGYKYYETRYEDFVLNQGQANSISGSTSGKNWSYEDEINYPFGYGLSYTEFTQTLNSVDVDYENKKIVANVTVKNIGDVAGKDAVQLYVNSPYTQYDIDNNVEKASVSLIGFNKTKKLQPNEEVTIEVEGKLEHLGSYDYTKAKTYILDYGDYYYGIGNGAHEAINNILAKKGKNVGNGMTEAGDVNKAVKIEYLGDGTKEVDDETLSISPYSDVKITNHLETGDVNYYYDDKKVTYLTRNNWKDTYPKKLVLTATDEMLDILANGATRIIKPEEEKNVVEGVDYSVKTTSYKFLDIVDKDYDDPIWDDLLKQMSIKDMTDLVCQRYSNPIESISLPGQVEFDGPSGIQGSYITDKKEYKMTCCKYMTEVAAAQTFSTEILKEMGELFGNEGLWTTYNAVWGPGSNIHRTAMSGRNSEYYSEDGVLSYYMGKTMSEGTIKYGLTVGPKHFFLNDQETNRGEINTFCNEQAAREIYLKPFEGPMADGKAYDCMTGKNHFGCYPISGHKGALVDIVKNEWNYRGSLITDSSTERNGLGAYCVINGLTQFDIDSSATYTKGNGSFKESLIKKDKELFLALKEATHRIIYMWSKTTVAGKLSPESSIVFVTPWYQTTMLGLMIGFGVITIAGVSYLVVDEVKNKKKKEIK